MDKFCTNCGAELNGKSKCDKCGNINGKAFQNIADKVKNYDYKSKADELKSKAGDIIDKAKNYDYKEKAEEITDNIKNFDYEEKAKQVSDTVKNYDYKSEAENIKKGGIKYFWNKHRKLSIILIVFVIAVAVIPNLGKEESENQSTTVNNTTNTGIEYKTKLSDEEIINISMMTFEAHYFSSSSPQFLSAENIEQDKYGRCCALLEYDVGMRRIKYLVFADGLTTDDKVNTNKGTVEETMNNSTLTKSTIKIRKEQFGWNTPR